MSHKIIGSRAGSFHQVLEPFHPTVKEHYQLFRAPHLAGGHCYCTIRRDDTWASDDFASPHDAEKAALAHLRSLPVK